MAKLDDRGEQMHCRARLSEGGTGLAMEANVGAHERGIAVGVAALVCRCQGSAWVVNMHVGLA